MDVSASTGVHLRGHTDQEEKGTILLDESRKSFSTLNSDPSLRMTRMSALDTQTENMKLKSSPYHLGSAGSEVGGFYFSKKHMLILLFVSANPSLWNGF